MRFNIIGVPRSGHTVIRNWIAWQLGENLNSVSHINYDTFGYSIERGSKCLCLTPHHEHMEFSPQLRGCINEYQKKHILLDTQSFSLGMLDGRKNYPSELNVPDIKNIIVLRDVYNLYASIIERDKYTPHVFERNIRATKDVWLSHAKWCLEGKSHILYNKWCVSKWYRLTTIWRLRLGFWEKKYSQIPHNGSGSSFNNIQTLTRYLDYKDHYMYRDYITEEMKQINHKLFGDIYK